MDENIPLPGEKAQLTNHGLVISFVNVLSKDTPMYIENFGHTTLIQAGEFTNNTFPTKAVSDSGMNRPLGFRKRSPF